MAGANTLTFNDDNFESEVLQADGPVLVDFWAPWCGPCQMLGPVIDELASDFKGKAKVGKLDVDSAPTTATRYHVQSIPTIMIFSKGQAVQTFVGLKKKSELQAALTAHLPR